MQRKDGAENESLGHTHIRARNIKIGRNIFRRYKF